MKILLLFSLVYCLSTVSSAQTTYFQQDFSAGGTISNYVDATNPGISKFTSISMSSPSTTTTISSTYAIYNGALQTYRPTDIGGASYAPGDPYAVYSVNFSPAPTSFYIQFSFDGLPVSYEKPTTSAAVLFVGSGFSDDAAINIALNQIFARISINTRYTTINSKLELEWGLHWIKNSGVGSGSGDSPYFRGQHNITWVLNRAGGQLSYLTPPPAIGSPASETLANGKWDVWVDNALIFDEINALTPTVPLLNFKYVHANGIAAFRLDDFLFRDVSGVLPVRLTNFRAVINGAQVDLNWQLPTPDIGSTFVVERSRDGYEYTEISRHRALPDQHYFGTTDAEPLAGMSYYRLRHINAAGSSTLTAPIAVQIRDGMPGFTIRSNPSSGDQISLIINGLSDATYRLTTLTGQVLPCTTTETPDGQVTLLPQHRLPSGVYLLTATSGTIRFTRQVLVH